MSSSTFDSPANSPPQSPPPTVAAAAVDASEMQIVPASLYSTPFKLPDDWIVEVRPRGPNSAISSDKYYYEPGTGRKFRSLASVRRYLNGEQDPPPTKKPSTCLVPYFNSGSFKRVSHHGKVLRPDELEEARYTMSDDVRSGTLQFKSAESLPDGWIVEEIPRRCGFRSDRYFIDPATGQRFRSMPEVHRFLEEQRYTPKRKALTLSNFRTAPRSSVSRKKNSSFTTFKDTLFDLMHPPKKINWVYSGDGKDNWSPLVEECVLPNYVTEQWSETFLLGMNGLKHRLPQLTMKESSQ
ncbi:hypothetical protein RND81_01G007500 [Saponaria officinalis]|uniref:MBD domain-containing protein n=1 Tax=Saponaria officinalis TaxID=3572 RepID=A0AAW1NAS1_SAPOF